MGKPPPSPAVIAVDPGRDKCGVAVVRDTEVVLRALIPTAELAITCRYLLAAHPAAQVVLGDGTTSREALTSLHALLPDVAIELAPEANTTLEARARYWRDHAPTWWQRLMPTGMRLPARPVDDYAAVLLAERALAGPR